MRKISGRVLLTFPGALLSLWTSPMINIPFSELEFSYARSRGPGGQNVNKTNSAAILRWNVLESPSLSDFQRSRILEKLGNQITVDGDLIIRSETQRDQDQNRSECIKKLNALLEKAMFIPKKRRATKPTRGSVRKRLESKKIKSDVKSLRQRVKD